MTIVQMESVPATLFLALILVLPKDGGCKLCKVIRISKIHISDVKGFVIYPCKSQTLGIWNAVRVHKCRMVPVPGGPSSGWCELVLFGCCEVKRSPYPGPGRAWWWSVLWVFEREAVCPMSWEHLLRSKAVKPNHWKIHIPAVPTCALWNQRIAKEPVTKAILAPCPVWSLRFWPLQWNDMNLWKPQQSWAISESTHHEAKPAWNHWGSNRNGLCLDCTKAWTE